MSNQTQNVAEERKNNQNLPNFMSENSKINYAEEENASSWLTNNLHRLMIWVSVIWFAVVIIYITQFFGWSNLFLMMPDEFGGFLAGVTLPLAIIWVVMAYIDRGTSFKNEARFLRAYMNQLVYPEDGGASTAKAMADAIRSQVIELQEVTKLATEQTAKIKEELGGRVEDFAKLVAVLDNYSGKTMSEMTEGVKTLINSFDYVNEKTAGAAEEFKNNAADFSITANQIQKNMSDLTGILLPRIQEIKTSASLLQNMMESNNDKMLKSNEMLLEFSNKSNQNMLQVSEMLSSQSERLEQISGGALNNCRQIQQDLDNSVGKISGIMKDQGKLVLDHIERLTKNADNITDKIAEQGEKVGIEVDKVLARASGIEESISMQVRELTGVSEVIADRMNTVEENIGNKVSILSSISEKAVSDINDVIGSLEENTVKLSDAAKLSSDKTGAVIADISEKRDNINKSAENIIANLKLLSEEISDKAHNIRRETENSINNFKEVSDTMKKNTDGLVEASSIVVAQSKIGEASLAQQQRHITGSVTKIEEIKGELKRQIDELSRAAAILSDEADSAVNNLKGQMEQTLKYSEEVVNKTKALNDNLQVQASEFNSSTNKTMAKALEFEDIMNGQHQKLESLSQTVFDRAENIAQTLAHQVELVDTSTENTRKTFNELTNSFETQSTLLNSVAENTVGYVSDVVQALDEKAEAIHLLFKHQENEFFEICDKLSENTSNIGGSLKKQVSVIEQSADRVLARMALLEEDVNKRAETVVSNSMKSIDRLSEIDISISEKKEILEKLVNEAGEKLNLVINTFRNNLSEFSGIVKDIREEGAQTTAAILDNCNQVNTASETMNNEAKNVALTLDGQIKNLDVALVKVRAQADMIKDTFEHQKESLTDIVNVVSTQTRLGEASLAQQYKYLSDTANEVSAKMNEINAQFKDNTDKVFDTSTKIAYEVDVLGDRLLKVGEDIAKASKVSIKNVEQVNMALSQSAEDLDLAVATSTQKVGSVMKDYQQYIANFNTVTAEASTGVVEINDLITQQSDKMIKISEDTKQLVECFNVVLNDTSIQLSNRANQAYDKVKGLGENLKTLSLQLEDATKMSSKHFETAGDKLRATIGEIATNAERISNEIRTSGEVFLKQSGVLVAATDDTLTKVSNVMNAIVSTTEEFNNKSEDIIEKSVSFNDIVNKQLKVLNDTSGKAENKIKALVSGYENIQADTFLKDASYIIEKLETFAVDINRIFNPAAEDELWKKYYNGDTSAFVRYLAKSMSRSQIIAVRNEFEKNLDFRNTVNKYLAEFETLISKAKSNERSGILLSVISGADIGKLYFILAKALDKLN